MRNRQQRREVTEQSDSTVWPDERLDVDDDAFARAIAEGRRDVLAA